MVVAIVGSREFNDERFVRRFVNKLPTSAKVISGGARGVDSWAVSEADACDLEWEEIEANWKDLSHEDAVIKTRSGGDEKYDAMAGFRRNTKLVERADWVVAFWDGESKGTKDTIDKAIDKGVSLNIYVR